MARTGRSCFVSSCRISHFGINPVSGGRPPRERRISGARDVITGVLVHEVAREFTFVALLILNTRNVEKVMTK